VPDFSPFRGTRYVPARLAGTVDDVLGAVVAPPYDVIDEPTRAMLEAAHPDNVVRLILPRAEGADRYQQAATTLTGWQARGVVADDDAPAFYRYRMEVPATTSHPARHTMGVVGALGLGGPGTGPGDHDSALPHEHTMARAKSDRLDLLRATRTNLDPIWCLSGATGLSRLLGTADAEPADAGDVRACVDPDGVRHTLTALWGAEVHRAIAEAVAAAPVMIADGHHRYETACAYRDERALMSHIDDPGAGAIMSLVVELTDDELAVAPIHRVVTGGPADVRAALDAAFVVHDAGPSSPSGVAALRQRIEGRADLGLVDKQGLAVLEPRPDIVAVALGTEPEPLRAVPATLFETVVRPALPGADITYRDDATAVTGLVADGAADAAVLLGPVTVDQIRAAAAAGLRMPPKTSFFVPKPRTGLVLRRLDA